MEGTLSAHTELFRSSLQRAAAQAALEAEHILHPRGGLERAADPERRDELRSASVARFLIRIVGYSETNMLRIPRRFSHYVFGIIQSGVTCAIATAITSYPLIGRGTFAVYWLQSWLVAWISMLPVVLFAAPVIRKMTHALTRDD